MRVRPFTIALGVALAIAGLTATVLLAVYLRDIVRDLLAGPLGYALYLAGLLLRSVPQALFLGMLIVLGVVIAFNTISARRDDPGLPPGHARPDHRHSRMRMWTYYLSQFGRSAYAQEKMTLEMRALILSSLAVLERSTPVDIERRIINGSMDVPAEVADLVLASRSRAGSAPRSRFMRIAEELRERISGRILSDAAAAQQSPVWVKLQAALAWIEAQQYTDEKGKDS